VHRPFAEPGGQIAQQPGVPGGLAGKVEGEAVQEVVIDDRQATPSHPLAAGFEPDADRQAVLASQDYGQGEDVVASAIGEAVSVQVRRAQTGTDHGLHLRAELDLDLVQPNSSEQFRDSSRRGQLAFRVQQ
jgi:hypothetical protein